MCLALVFYKHFPGLKLLVLFNRDEFFERPTERAHWWSPDLQSGHDRLVLGGRDAVRGGTWLAVNRQGRLAFVTNIREKRDISILDPENKSRGCLPIEFLLQSSSPVEFLDRLKGDPLHGHHAGYNIVCLDCDEHDEGAYYCNRHSQTQLLSPGIYSLANSHIGDVWPKGEKGQQEVVALLHNAASSKGVLKALPWDELFKIMSDPTELVGNLEEAPKTGYPAEFERMVSGILVPPIDVGLGLYGTRSQTIIAVWEDNTVELRERNKVLDKNTWEQVQYVFEIMNN